MDFTFRFGRSFDINRNLELSFLYFELKLPFNVSAESRWAPKYLYDDVWLMLVPLICMLSGASFLTRIEVPTIRVWVLRFFNFKDRSLSVNQLWASRISAFSFVWIDSESFPLTWITVSLPYLIILEWRNSYQCRPDRVKTMLDRELSLWNAS